MSKYGIDISFTHEPLGFIYGDGVIGPPPETRSLDSVREAIQDRNASGPKDLYAIGMDVHMKEDRDILDKYNLLFGIVVYNKGQIGKEPIRSQGHKHTISVSCNLSTPEVYQIFEGEAYIYMQSFDEQDAGDCYAIHSKPGDIVVVPPNVVHMAVNADVDRNMAFGAWCVKDYGFDYNSVRKYNGVAFYPQVNADKSIDWVLNPNYKSGKLHIVKARDYPEFEISPNVPVYKQFRDNPKLFHFVSNPQLAETQWAKMKDQGY